MPPIPAPDFAAAARDPAAITRAHLHPRCPAGAFDGIPEPADDLAMGLSETILDLAGHHLVTSGGMCLGVGTTLIDQLNVGTIGLLVPSLGELRRAATIPLLLVTRPQKRARLHDR